VGGVDWMHVTLVKRPVADPCEYGNEHSVSMKGGKFLDYLSNY
jgi:hypothetical protein